MKSDDLSSKLNILLADDDKDDCLLFKVALEELELQTQLTTVYDGDQLMQLLTKDSNENFDVLFLDLNMPRKNGITCLEEIQRHDLLKLLPIIIFSTSCDLDEVKLLSTSGAQYYICKPADFSDLKKIIQKAIFLVSKRNKLKPFSQNFLL